MEDFRILNDLKFVLGYVYVMNMYILFIAFRE